MRFSVGLIIPLYSAISSTRFHNKSIAIVERFDYAVVYIDYNDISYSTTSNNLPALGTREQDF